MMAISSLPWMLRIRFSAAADPNALVGTPKADRLTDWLTRPLPPEALCDPYRGTEAFEPAPDVESVAYFPTRLAATRAPAGPSARALVVADDHPGRRGDLLIRERDVMAGLRSSVLKPLLRESGVRVAMTRDEAVAWVLRGRGSRGSASARAVTSMASTTRAGRPSNTCACEVMSASRRVPSFRRWRQIPAVLRPRSSTGARVR